MLRRRLTMTLFAGVAALVAGTRMARAESSGPADSTESESETTPEPHRAGFEILGSAGYGRSTADVLGVELEPYGASFGLDAGYVFRPGFRVGASAVYGLGRTIMQRRTSRFGDEVDLEVDASSLNLGVSLGYDVPLYFLVLRSSLVFGGSFMRWDLGAPSNSIFANSSGSPSAGFFVAPGLTLLWPRRVFEWGVGFDYVVEANGAIPPGLLGKLVMGAKF